MPTTASALKKKRTTASAKKEIAQKTRVVVVLDDSYSMNHLRRPAELAFNKTIDDIVAQAKATRQEDTRITLYAFGEFIDMISDFNVPLEKICHVRNYNPIQSHTRLFDATAEAIKAMHDIERDDGADCAFLLMVVTDGGENFSSIRAPELNEMIRKAQETDRYTLTFLLPPGHKANFCGHFSVPEGNVAEWAGTVEGVRHSAEMRTSGLSHFFTARAAGATSTKGFYTTNASNIKPQDLQTKMQDITSQVKSWTVNNEAPDGKPWQVRAFIENNLRGAIYVKGRAYYQLSKPEVVQSYKEMLLMEKGKRSVFHGLSIRSMLGLPSGNIRVVPGNHANYDIFVQSTSVNRKLVRGTKVIYWL